ncbi:MAG TPA: GDP-mannose 4,6-dehydratase [Bacteroidota bacterium]|nr:GDP-mannose 4,6-dehydratase [Bacteroidota bacterium]
MRVLITGIDGFVGSHAAEYLLGIPGVELHGTHYPGETTGNIDHLRGRITLHEADIVDAVRIRNIVAEVRPDKVVHLAGQAFVPTALRDPIGTFSVNIMGGVALLDAVRRQAEASGAGPDLLMVSSAEVYGRLHTDPITEETPVRPDNPYAVSKASVDLIAQVYRRTFGVRVSVVRPFNHAGPRQSPVFVASDFGRQFALIAAGKSAPVVRAGDIDTRRDFTDVRDVVRAYWAILTHPSEHTVFNLCSGHVVAIRDLIDILQRVSGIRVTILPEESRKRGGNAPFMAGSYALLHGATGWEPTIPLEKTLADVFAYWQTAAGIPT